ncbi:MAG: protease modulator HflK [Pseudomonadota bacterium]
MSRASSLRRVDRGPKRRRSGADHELLLFLSPLTRLLGLAWQRMPLVVASFALLYAVSGISIIEADEVGIVLRFGAITRSSDGPVIHRPGMLLAYPKPFDEVIRVKVDRIETIVIDELALPRGQVRVRGAAGEDLAGAQEADGDPHGFEQRSSIVGYALTGDRNLAHAQLVARYRVSDPIERLLLASDAEDFLRSALRESMTRLAGGRHLDDLLGGGREQFARAVMRDAQSRLDKVRVGLELVSIELEHLSPPSAVEAAFDSVQSAYIEAQTLGREANVYAAQLVPAAKAQAQEIVSRARAASLALTSAARAESSAFAALLPSYQATPELVRQRLYREGLERALGGVGELKLVPPPGAGGYGGTRFLLSLPSGSASSATPSVRAVGDVDQAEPPRRESVAVESVPTEGSSL